MADRDPPDLNDPAVGVETVADAHRRQWQFRDSLPMWVVYRPITTEYPGKWVARMWLTLPQNRPTRIVFTGDSLHAVRSLLPHGLILLARNPEDVPEIEETWL